jgi:uncharacterized membrane protein
MTGLKVWNLQTSFADLGIFDRFFWAITSKFEWQWVFFGHAQPLLFIESLGYMLWSSPTFLVVLQGFLLSIPAFLFYSMARHMDLELDTLVPIAYMLYFPVWYNALFDFHMDHLAVIFGALFYFACLKKRWFFAALSAVGLCLIKEPYALSAAFCGIYLIVKRQRVLGLCVLLFGIAYFYYITTVLIPAFTPSMASSLGLDAFSWMGGTIFEIIFFLITHPLTVFEEIFFDKGKIIYFITLFGALGFIPFLSPLELLPALPILGISMLSHSENYYGLGHHYTAALIAPIIAAFATGLPRAISLCEKIGIPKSVFSCCILVILTGFHFMISPSPVSRLFLTNKVWGYGYETYIPSSRNNMIKRALISRIPQDSNISVAVQNTVNNGHLSHRNFCFLFPEGVTKPVMLPKVCSNGLSLYPVFADYVVLDLKRPWYLKDQGCRYQKDSEPLISERVILQTGINEITGTLKWASCTTQEFRRKFISEVKKTFLKYNVVFEQDGFLILKRNIPD